MPRAKRTPAVDALRQLTLTAFSLAGPLGCCDRGDDPQHLATEADPVCDLDKARREMPDLEQQCSKGVAESCFSLGTMIHGRPWCGPATIEPQRIRAWGLFEKACMLGNEDGCFALGNGAGTPFVSEAANEELDRGCTNGVGYACSLRGERVMDFWPTLPPDPPGNTIREALIGATHEAYPWFRRACELGVQEGCFQQALALQRGVGLPHEHEQAAKLLAEACRDQRTNHRPLVSPTLACIWLGLAYERGLGLPRDHQRGHELLHESCRIEQVCDDALFLVAERKRRSSIWMLEAMSALAPNVWLLWAKRRRRRVTGWLWALLLCTGALAGLSIAWELFFYFTGSRYASLAWWSLALLPVIYPLAWPTLRSRSTAA